MYIYISTIKSTIGLVEKKNFLSFLGGLPEKMYIKMYIKM
jgi:hypothetical protein